MIKDAVNIDSVKCAFQKVASEAHRDFPDELPCLYVGAGSKTLYESDDAKDEKTRPAYMTHAIADHREYFDKHDDCAIASRDFVGCSIILFSGNLEEESYSNTFLPAHCSATDDLICALSHELGHYIVPEGNTPEKQLSHLNESAADAYALLRYIQMKGTDAADDVFKHYPYNRANTMPADKKEYYTVTVVHKIDRLRKEMDITALTPEQTKRLAGKIAREYHLSDQTIARIYSALSPLKDYQKKHDLKSKMPKSPDKNLVYYKLIHDIMHENKNDHDVWRACKLLLSQHMDIMREKAATSPGFWREFVSFIDAHEKEAGIILDLSVAMDAAKKQKLGHTSVKRLS